MTKHSDGIRRIVDRINEEAQGLGDSTSHAVRLSNLLDGAVATLTQLGLSNTTAESLQDARNEIEVIAAVAVYEHRGKLTAEECKELAQSVQSFLSHLPRNDGS